MESVSDLREARDYLDKLFRYANAPIIVWDPHYRITRFNRAFEQLTGYAAEEVLGQDLSLLFPESARAASLEAIARATQGEHWDSVEITVLRKDGQERVALWNSANVYAEDGATVVATIAQGVDISRRKRAETDLRETRDYLDKLFRYANAPIIVWDPLYRITRFNHAFEQLTGYAAEEVLGQDLSLLFPESEREASLAAIERASEGEQWESVEITIRREDGRERVALWNSANVFAEDGVTVLATIAQGVDITARKEAEALVTYMAHYDQLTGLPNRTLFQDRVDHALARAERDERPVALIFVDLDNFKNVNDTLGHDTGDLLLQYMAGRLRRCVRREDSLARLGGDEFTILVEDYEYLRDVVTVAEKVVQAMVRPFHLNGYELSLSLSMGISVYPENGRDRHALLKHADTAMYSAKESGRNTYRFFAPEMNARMVRRLQLENSLRRALDRDELALHYLPQFELGSRRIIGLEALLRWNTPHGGLMSPEEFIPIAEETGLILPIGEWVLREACRQGRAWHEAGLTNLRVAVNLSPRQFRQRNLARVVASVLDQCGLDPRFLELEITETLIMEDAQANIATLQELKEMGVRVAVDDFGTGYSSLAYLKRFPIDQLKIDRAFVRDIHTNPEDAAIVGAILALARTLQFDALAEGVENESQRTFLWERGCELGQGFLFGPPMPGDQVVDHLVSHGVPLRAAVH